MEMSHTRLKKAGQFNTIVAGHNSVCLPKDRYEFNKNVYIIQAGEDLLYIDVKYSSYGNYTKHLQINKLSDGLIKHIGATLRAIQQFNFNTGCNIGSLKADLSTACETENTLVRIRSNTTIETQTIYALIDAFVDRLFFSLDVIKDAVVSQQVVKLLNNRAEHLVETFGVTYNVNLHPQWGRNVKGSYNITSVVTPSALQDLTECYIKQELQLGLFTSLSNTILDKLQSLLNLVYSSYILDSVDKDYIKAVTGEEVRWSTLYTLTSLLAKTAASYFAQNKWVVTPRYTEEMVVRDLDRLFSTSDVVIILDKIREVLCLEKVEEFKTIPVNSNLDYNDINKEAANWERCKVDIYDIEGVL